MTHLELLGCSHTSPHRLNGYYIFIHPYFPILPSPTNDLHEDNPSSQLHNIYQPASPLGLAIAAILALIPHPADILPSTDEARMHRRQKSHQYAQSSLQCIENDSEMLESIICPEEALANHCSSPQRMPFHPATPVELESLLALLLLSIYEYAQRGNIGKMRNRASQALDAAMGMSLHRATSADQFREARRRAWWMTVCLNNI